MIPISIQKHFQDRNSNSLAKIRAAFFFFRNFFPRNFHGGTFHLYAECFGGRGGWSKETRIVRICGAGHKVPSTEMPVKRFKTRIQGIVCSSPLLPFPSSSFPTLQPFALLPSKWQLLRAEVNPSKIAAFSSDALWRRGFSLSLFDPSNDLGFLLLVSYRLEDTILRFFRDEEMYVRETLFSLMKFKKKLSKISFQRFFRLKFPFVSWNLCYLRGRNNITRPIISSCWNCFQILNVSSV